MAFGYLQKVYQDAYRVNLLYYLFAFLSSDFWIMGDSIIYWAGQYALQQGRRHLSLNKTIDWQGIRGMSWVSFRHRMQLKAVFDTPPRALCIHLGGNDIESMSLCRIFALMRSGLKYIHAAFVDARLVWVDILPRLTWSRGSKEDKKRRRVNRFGRQLCRHLKGDFLSTEIDNLTPGFYRRDGVHLSQVGLEMFLDAIKDKLSSFC